MTMLLGIPAGICGLFASKVMNNVVGDTFDKADREDGFKATALKVVGVALMALSLVMMVLSVAAIAYPISFCLTAALSQIFSPFISEIITTIAVVVPFHLISRDLVEWLDAEKFNKAPCC